MKHGKLSLWAGKSLLSEDCSVFLIWSEGLSLTSWHRWVHTGECDCASESLLVSDGRLTNNTVSNKNKTKLENFIIRGDKWRWSGLWHTDIYSVKNVHTSNYWTWFEDGERRTNHSRLVTGWTNHSFFPSGIIWTPKANSKCAPFRDKTSFDRYKEKLRSVFIFTCSLLV